MQKGFTLIEILVAIVILSICVTIVLISLSKVNPIKMLEKDAQAVLSIVNEARQKTLSGLNGSQYGVNFQYNQVVSFTGSSYATTTSSNIFTPLSPQVGIRNISVSGGGTSVVFQRLTGESQSATLEVYLLSSTSTYKQIVISATGFAEIK